MNKRLNKYIEDNQDLNNLRPYESGEDNPTDHILNYFQNNCPTTYYKDGQLQCYSNSNRSFVDIYFLTKASFPDITMEEVAHIMTYQLCIKDYSGKNDLTAIKCPQIGKVVWRKKEPFWKSFQERNSVSSYGSARTVGVDGLSWNSIMVMADRWIKKQNKLNNG